MSHTIGTYNMSFMSDLTLPIGPGMQWASEAAFLARLYGKPEERRSYWINALNLLKDFLIKKQPSVVGLQEINLTNEGSGTGKDAIDKMLEGTGYKQISRSVPKNNAGLSIIYNPEKIGDLKHVECIDNPNQNGRPLLMLITEKDGKHYLSVSIHGAQDPNLRLDKDGFNTYMIEINKNFLQSSASTFLTSNNIKSPAGIFIMGDFNDRYDGIREIIINGKRALYTGKAPKSCCYNWDSSCPDGDQVEKDFYLGYSTCKVPAVQTGPNGKITLPDERGNTKNYRYAGDKVFGLNPETQMAIYRPDGWNGGDSTESDHELVYATVGEAMAGGRRRSKTKRSKRKAKSKGRSRKNRK
jgi:hypothetical protein